MLQENKDTEESLGRGESWGAFVLSKSCSGKPRAEDGEQPRNVGSRVLLSLLSCLNGVP